MKLKYILSVIAIVAVTKNSFAQYSQDAIRFSGGQTGSTSRIKAIGNAGIAIGGDLSSVAGNPAGLGFFTHSEVSITPEYDATKADATYLGQFTTDKKNSGNLNNAAFVFYKQLAKPRGADRTKGWLSVNYGAGYSRTNDYYQNIHYTGVNNSNSINDYYAEQANSYGIDENTLPGWAYDHNLIDQYGITNPTYRSNAFTGTAQESYVTRTGGLSAFDAAIGANYSNKLYIGLGMSFTALRYNSYNTFYEDGSLSVLEGTPAVPVTRDYSSAYSQQQNTTGSGFNARLGLIYKPVEALRLGFNFTTPTWYNIDDVYSEKLNTSISNGNIYRSGPADYPLNYNLRTPLKVAGGAAVFIKQFGFITGDVEYVDYSSAHLSSNVDYDSSGDNLSINNLYKSVVNAHIGAEARLTPNVLLRGGYGIQGDARKDYGSDIKTVSGGLGLRFGSYYVDATYTHSTGSQTIFPYEIATGSPAAYLNNTSDKGFLTLGYRF